MALRCNLCERDLTRHCRVPATDKDRGRETCSWWDCTNQACPADRYDVMRGILRYKDGHLEQLGA